MLHMKYSVICELIVNSFKKLVKWHILDEQCVLMDLHVLKDID